jgi:hypothetical protein
MFESIHNTTVYIKGVICTFEVIDEGIFALSSAYGKIVFNYDSCHGIDFATGQSPFHLENTYFEDQSILHRFMGLVFAEEKYNEKYQSTETFEEEEDI